MQDLLEALKHVGDIEHYVAVLKREAAALERVLGQLTPAGLAEPHTTASTGTQHTDGPPSAQPQANPPTHSSAGASSLEAAAAEGAAGVSTPAGDPTALTSTAEAGTASRAAAAVAAAGSVDSPSAPAAAVTPKQQLELPDPSAAPLPVSKRAFC